MPKKYQTELDGAEAVFNLFSEETQDGDKLKREREQRERDRAEAAQLNAKLQPQLI